MCLTTLDKKKPKPSGFGYKVFTAVYDKKGLYGLFFPQYTNGKVSPYPMKKWMDSRQTKIGYGPRYLSGWHIYKHIRDARRHAGFGMYKMARVEYKGATCSGSQGGPVVVAKQMKILKRVK